MTGLGNTFPEHLALRGGIRWRLAGRAWMDAARVASDAIRDPEIIPDAKLLKSGTRRLVFADGTGAAEPGAAGIDADRWVIKAFPLDGLRSRLKHRKYARSEAANLILARQRSVPAPAVHALGEQRRLGLVVWNAVIMDWVGGRTFSEALHRAADDGERLDVLRRCARLFRLLYRAGCNHIDLKPEAVRIGQDTAADGIIDFQYCTFRDGPSLDTVMAQAGHFAHWWEKQDPGDSTWISCWVEHLLGVLEVPPARRAAALRVLENHRRRVPSIAERLLQ